MTPSRIGVKVDWSNVDPLAAAATILAAFIGLTGLMITGSIRRTTQLKVAEQRLAAYQKLWNELEPAQFHPKPDKDFDEEGRKQLARAMTTWYYASGIFLTDGCRNIFLKASHNLDAATNGELKPKSLGVHLANHADWKALPSDDVRRAALSREQLSLLRTRMKADLGQYGRWYVRRSLTATEREFLEECGESLWSRPWRHPLRHILMGPGGGSHEPS